MKILIVHKKSTYLRYLDSNNQQLKNFLSTEHQNAILLKKDYQIEEKAIKEVEKVIKKLNFSYEIIIREKLKKVENKDLVITVGGDGTFLDVSHFIIDETPVLGINSNPNKSVGFFCTATSKNIREILENIDKFPEEIAGKVHHWVSGR